MIVVSPAPIPVTSVVLADSRLSTAACTALSVAAIAAGAICDVVAHPPVIVDGGFSRYVIPSTLSPVCCSTVAACERNVSVMLGD